MERTTDIRGNSTDRYARKSWLLGQTYSDRYGWSPYGGDGERVPCVHCDTLLTRTECTADRIVPESDGGTYVYSNCQPSCEHCNAARGNRLAWTGPSGWRPLTWVPGEKVGRKWVQERGWLHADGTFMPMLRQRAAAAA